MIDRKNIYENVPHKGRRYKGEEGVETWWTNCRATVGETIRTPQTNGYESWVRVSKCVEVATFDGRPFARWILVSE